MVKKQILNKVLKNAPRSHFAPGLIFLASEDGDILYKTAIGHHTYDPSSPKVNFKTIYDIASITKAIVATGALLLIDQGKLKLSDQIGYFFPFLQNKFVGTKTIWNLLTHTTHFHNIRLSLLKKPITAKKILDALSSLKIDKKQKDVVEFANINTFLLGEIIQIVNGKSLDTFLTKNLFIPLEMQDTMFNPSLKYKGRIPPTSLEDEKKGQRKVHDPSARELGGICGQAGLFSTALDLNNFLEMWTNLGKFKKRTILSEKIAKLAIKNHTPYLNLKSGLGWHLENKTYLGPYCPPNTFFHPGFTGTIILGSIKPKITAVFLSNHTFPKPQDVLLKQKLFQKIFSIVFKNKN